MANIGINLNKKKGFVYGIKVNIHHYVFLNYTGEIQNGSK